MSMDISSVVSKPITVLSKRINKPGNKRRAGHTSATVKRPSGVCGQFRWAPHLKSEGEEGAVCWSLRHCDAMLVGQSNSEQLY